MIECQEKCRGRIRRRAVFPWHILLVTRCENSKRQNEGLMGIWLH